MALHDELAALDALAQAALVREREVTAVELVDAAIDRIERVNPRLNAVISRRYEDARAEAAAIDRDGLPGSALAGVPFLLKDLGATIAGTPQWEGSRAARGRVSTADTELGRRYRAAGLVILGKTNTPEFGNHSTAEPESQGPSRNPWDVTRTTGGSSGGSAAAVASGMVPAAHGNDGAGSIRIPASCCATVGLKPTRGRNSWAPAGDAMAGLAVEHVLTRSVRDSAAILDATAGRVAGDPYSAPAPDRP
ncbi:MAG: amidase, partial [Betaproteobacteria bacterium]